MSYSLFYIYHKVVVKLLQVLVKKKKKKKCDNLAYLYEEKKSQCILQLLNIS